MLSSEVLAVLAGERPWAVQCGDALELLPLLPAGCVDAVVTDPVWPNATADLAGRDDPAGLFAAAATHFPRLAKRLVVQLGIDSDPRFLLGVPAALPFFRVCWLEYAFPNCKGRLLNSGDVAYVFGEPPLPRKGRMVVPGRCTSGRVDYKAPGTRRWQSKQTTRRVATLVHPSPRRLEHVAWLVRWLGDGLVLDPFCGTGTTGTAALRLGLPFLGFEISEEYAALSRRRLERAEREQKEMLFPASGARQLDFTEGEVSE